MDRQNRSYGEHPHVRRDQEKGVSKEIVESLGNLEASVDLVNKIFKLSNQFDIESETSYRKIHDVFSSVLDSTLSMITSETFISQVDQVYLNLAKVRVIIEYQRARRQISDNIAEVLKGAIDKLKEQLDKVKKENNQTELQRLRRLIENIRIVIDSFAVLAKAEGRK